MGKARRAGIWRVGPVEVPLPRYMSEYAAGMDLHAALVEPVLLKPGERCVVPTGLALELPPDCEGQVRPRSGLAIRHGITVINAPGTIDADYRGELRVGLVHHGDQPYTIEPLERIAQLVVATVTRIEWDLLEAEPGEVPLGTETARGAGGFGSTGRGKESGGK